MVAPVRSDSAQSAQAPPVVGEPKARVPGTAEIWLLGCAAGCAVAVGTVVAQWFFYNYLLQTNGVRLVGPIVAGVLTLIFTQQMMEASRRRRLQTMHRFQIIAEMNHHIRNSLQMISYQSFSADAAAAERLKDAVDRIQWVLQEVLPGVHDGDMVARKPSQSEHSANDEQRTA